MSRSHEPWVAVLEEVSHPKVRAKVLAEAVTHVRWFKGKRIVVKIGGRLLTDPVMTENFTSDVFMLHELGMRPIVVHGGGPQITEWMGKVGLASSFSNGHRVTDAATLDLVRMVLVGKINREIVSGINKHGTAALGLSGEDGGLLKVKPRDPQLGFVGDVTDVDTRLVDRLLAEDLIPVIATIGVGEGGQAYNVNADLGAAAVAVATGAAKLIYLTDVDGLMRRLGDPSTLIQELDVADLETLAIDGAVSEGMIPKVEGCLQALSGGVTSAHILNGAIPHALLVEVLSDRGVGTMITREKTS